MNVPHQLIYPKFGPRHLVLLRDYLNEQFFVVLDFLVSYQVAYSLNFLEVLGFVLFFKSLCNTLKCLHKTRIRKHSFQVHSIHRFKSSILYKPIISLTSMDSLIKFLSSSDRDFDHFFFWFSECFYFIIKHLRKFLLDYLIVDKEVANWVILRRIKAEGFEHF